MVYINIHMVYMHIYVTVTYVILWLPHAKSWLIGKDPDAGRDWGQEEKGTTEDEMAGWHHRLDAHEFGWTPGVGDGQGGLVWCDSWGRKESDTTEQLNWTELNICYNNVTVLEIENESSVRFLYAKPKWDTRQLFYWSTLYLIPGISISIFKRFLKDV